MTSPPIAMVTDSVKNSSHLKKEKSTVVEVAHRTTHLLMDNVCVLAFSQEAVRC